MKHFTTLISRFAAMIASPESGDDFYRLLLEAAIGIVPRATMGTVSLVDGRKWRFVAAIGHDQIALSALDLDSAWDTARPDIREVRSMTKEHYDQMPPSTLAAFRAAACPTSWTLIGSYDLTRSRRVALTLDMPKGRLFHFSADDKENFASLLSMAAAWESVLESRRELVRAKDKMQRLLNLTSRLGQIDDDMSGFYAELLGMALSVTEEADFGSISLLTGGKWRFVSAFGHDLEALERLEFEPGELIGADSVKTVERILEACEARMDEGRRHALVQASRPIERSLVVGLEIDSGHRINFTLDIAGGSSKHFTEGSIANLQRFVQVAGGYLKVRIQAETISSAWGNFVDKLAILAEAHDHGTQAHNRRVAELSEYLADRMGMERSLCAEVKRGAALHDIGKLFLSADLLNSKNPLDDAQRAIVERHTVLAKDLLDDPYFDKARAIAVYHHERHDGTGYPAGLKGDEIPIEAQIVAVADVFDALRSSRSYKRELSAKEAISRIKEGDERHGPGAFNPYLVSLLWENYEEIDRLFYRDEA
jgi:HD-GYP domain-containing protein (c-di-GMP phosphodiesterase class II)